MIEDELEKRISELEKRVINLEKRSLKEYTILPDSENSDVPKHKGLTGGIIFLIDDGFFKTPKSSRETYEELKREGYYYRVEAADTILRRDFVQRKKILARIKEEGIWKYALRK